MIPEGVLPTEIAHTGLTERHVVATMHERKALMAELSDGFIALPGGVGHARGAVRGVHLDAARHPSPSRLRPAQRARLLRRTARRSSTTPSTSGFLRPQHREMMMTADSADGALAALEAFEPPAVGKWMDRDGPRP